MTITATHAPSLYLGAVLVKWTGLLLDDVGTPVYIPNHSDKQIHIFGELSGATVTIQGSCDETAKTDPASADWFTVYNINGDLMAKTAKGGWLISDNPLFLRAITTGGDGSTLVNVNLLAKRG